MCHLDPAASTPPALVHRPAIRNDFAQPSPQRQTSSESYQDLVAGTTRAQNTATVALPAHPFLGGRYVHAIWPVSPDASRGKSAATAATTHATDDGPALRGLDGTRMSFTGQPGVVYTLLQSPGRRLNGTFRSWGDRQPGLDRIGLLLIAPTGYSRIEVGPQADGQVETRINGLSLQAGQSIRLADGGLLHVARDAQHLYMRSPQAETIAIRIHSTPSGPLLGLRLYAANRDTKLSNLGGLLAQTFQTPSRPRHISPDGEIYRGSIEELRVSSGLFGPAAANPQESLFPTEMALGPVYEHYFGLPAEQTFTTLSPDDIMKQWQWINQQSVQLDLIQNAAARERKLREQERKQELLLAAALKGGHIDLAILLLAATETQAANDLTRRLVSRIHNLQKQRQTLSAQMAQVGQTEDAAGTSQLQSLVTQTSNIATEISLLQTFLQDAVASKRNIQEFASNWIQQSHQTTRSIIQSIGR